MRYKYVTNAIPKRLRRRNRPTMPHKWITGPDPLRREKYYAWMKHKAQAKYRKEEYHLTFDEWETLWTDELFEQRGRQRFSLCLSRLSESSWCVENVEVMTRDKHLKRNAEFRK